MSLGNRVDLCLGEREQHRNDAQRKQRSVTPAGAMSAAGLSFEDRFSHLSGRAIGVPCCGGFSAR